MGFQRVVQSKRYECLSTDEKTVVGIGAGSICTETDTGKEFIFSGTAWGPKLVQTSITGSLAKQGQKSVTVAGTAVALGAAQPLFAITILAKDTNTGNIFVGDNTVGSSNGFILVPGAGHSWTGSNLNVANFYINSAVSGEGVSWTGVI